MPPAARCCAELFAEHGERWLFPLGDVIPPGCAHFERGFLARADVYARTTADRDRVLDAPAWGTVHTIRFAPDSVDVIGPTMHALREVGPFRDAGLVALAGARRPWAIETVRVSGLVRDVDPLLRARTLPRLATVELHASHRGEVERALAQSPWRAHLARLVFAGDEYGSLAAWRALREQLGVPELAIALACPATGLASGWQVGFRADGRVVVRQVGWGQHATLEQLAELLGELPEGTAIELASTPTREATGTDVGWLRVCTGRVVGLAREPR